MFGKRRVNNLHHGFGGNVRSLVLFTIFFFSLLFPALSPANGKVDWNPQNWPQIRENIRTCATFLVPQDPNADGSVGALFSDLDVDSFRSAVQQAIAEKGREILLGSDIYLTGVEMGSQKEIREQFALVLKELGFGKEDFNIHVLSIPKRLVEKSARSLARAALQNLIYWFPSFERDYQSPRLSEISVAITANVAIEIPNVIYLFQALPSMDAKAVVTTHAITLVAYSIYTKALANWLSRSGNVATFLKQIATSLPFVANYAVFGNLSKIVEFFQANGWEATAGAFPEALANFAATQGLSVLLQTIFYTVVVVKGVIGWQQTREGTQDALDARVASQWVRAPILAVDAIALAMAAGTGSSPLYSFDIPLLGEMVINSGHALLAGITAAGSALIFWPQMLNPVLPGYRWFRSTLGTINDAICRVTGFRIPWMGSSKKSSEMVGDGKGSSESGGLDP